MKVIVITGASDGIGAEMARQLAHAHGNGVALVLAARNEQMLADVAGQCEALGAQALVVPTDVTMQDQCIRLSEKAVERFGRIDALINNAGRSAHALINNAGRSAHALFDEVSDLGWYEELMRINLWGSVWCTHAALPHLKASKGSIVAVSSIVGLVGVPGRTAYAATKFAMTGFFETLRMELKRAGVSVTTAYPGVVATKIRLRGFNAEGKPAGVSKLKEDDAMSVEKCARLIIEGMNRREREVVMTFKTKVGRFLKLVAPGMVEDMALAAVKDDAKPR